MRRFATFTRISQAGLPERENQHEDANHRIVRHRTSHHPGRDALCRFRRTRRGGLRGGRAWHHHRADPEDAEGPRQRDRPGPRHDRQAHRRQSDFPAHAQPAGLSGHRQDRHRQRRQGGGNRGQQSASGAAPPERRRHQGDPQMHLGAPRPKGSAHRLRRREHRRLRMRWPPGRGRHSQHDPAATGRGRA